MELSCSCVLFLYHCMGIRMLTRHETIEGGGKVGEVGLAKGRHLLGPNIYRIKHH